MKKFLAILLTVTMLLSCCGVVLAEDAVKTADIIIVGAGGGGMAAAIEAINDGAESVIILEKTGRTGGSLNFTSGSMSGAETIIQELDGIVDTKECYVQDILANGAQLGNEELIRAYVEEDTDTIQWLWDNGLSEYSVHAVFAPEHQLYTIARTYKPSAKDRANYKSAAHEILDAVLATEPYAGVTIDFNTTATALEANEQGQVLTVVATDANGDTVRYTAKKAVIMATGGYSGNPTMMSAFAKNGANYVLGGATASDGYGIYMMQEAGAYIDPTAMTYIPTFPMGHETAPGIGVIASSYMWKAGAISVNQEGFRFANENDADVVAREVTLEEQTNAVQYDIFTDKIIADTEALGSSVFWNFYYAPGKTYSDAVISADSIEELADKLGIPAENLKATIADYNAHVESGEPDEFGREYTEDAIKNNPSYCAAINKIEGDKYYAIALKALVVMTLGGVTVNVDGQVLDTAGEAIPGLYAAGECVGGIWGKFVSGGTGVMGPIVFGRLAARAAMNNEPATGYVAKEKSTTITAEMFAKPEADSEARFDMSKALKDGEYTATVSGQEGKMTVKVVVAEGKIANVEIVEAHETMVIAATALEKIPQDIVAANSPDVDIYSSATLTSGRIMDAVALCLEQAAE